VGGVKRLIAIAVAGMLGLVVLVSAGTWVYLNLIRDDPPERLSLDAAGEATGTTVTTASASAATVAPDAVDGRWTVGEGSEAGYRVPEILNGQRTEAVGRTDQLEGELTIAGVRATAATFTVDLASVTSDEDRRDNQFRGRIMDVATHPTATFVLDEPIDFAAVPAEGVRLAASARGRLTLRGTTRPVSFDVEAERSGDSIRIAGAIPITFSDYGIPNPSAGPAQVGDEGTLEFLLVLSR
jgi:polyisoprenoid-binding protein YceI